MVRLIVAAVLMLALAGGLWAWIGLQVSGARQEARSLRAELVARTADPTFVSGHFMPPHTPPRHFAVRDYLDGIVPSDATPLARARAFVTASKGHEARAEALAIRDGRNAIRIALRRCGNRYCEPVPGDITPASDTYWRNGQMRFSPSPEYTEIPLPDGAAPGLRAIASLQRSPEGAPAMLTVYLLRDKTWVERLLGDARDGDQVSETIARHSLILGRDLLADPLR